MGQGVTEVVGWSKEILKGSGSKVFRKIYRPDPITPGTKFPAKVL